MRVKRQREGLKEKAGHTQEHECGFHRDGDALKHKVWAPPARVIVNYSCITLYTFDVSKTLDTKKHSFSFSCC